MHPTLHDRLLTDVMRYHVLFRVFDGDAAQWLRVIEHTHVPPAERRFVRWLVARLARDPGLKDELRAFVDAMGLW